MTEPTMWGIHGGRTGDADSLFLRRGAVALGWAQVGDLSTLSPHRDAFKQRIRDRWPDWVDGRVNNAAGQLFRFVHEVQEDDLAVYPSKRDRLVHVGRITGPYVYDPAEEPGYPHHRSVSWLEERPRSSFTQGALYEIGSALSFFRIKTFAHEFQPGGEGGTEPLPASEDETVAYVAEDIQETTRDYIIKTLAQELKGHPFARFVAHLLEAMGYRTRVSPEGPDGGIDIVAHKDELGVEPPILKVQVKSTEGSIGDPVVSAVYGKVGSGEYGLLVTLGTFTSQARQFAKGLSNLRLIDGQDLIDLILDHYDDLDARYKALLPLKRVYVPEPLPDSSGG